MSTTTPKPEPAASLTEALTRIQQNLPHIQKTKTAQVQTKGGVSYSYQYADLADIQPEILPLLAEQGLTWTTRPTMTEHGFALVYALRHTSGEQEDGIYPLPNPNQRTAQELGSAITYARRYTLCCVTGIVPDEDEDGRISVSAQREADARREEERREQQELDDQRDVILDRVKGLAARLSRPLGEVAAAYLQVQGEPIGATVNLRALTRFADGMADEVEAATQQADGPAVEDGQTGVLPAATEPEAAPAEAELEAAKDRARKALKAAMPLGTKAAQMTVEVNRVLKDRQTNQKDATADDWAYAAQYWEDVVAAQGPTPTQDAADHGPMPDAAPTAQELRDLAPTGAQVAEATKP